MKNILKISVAVIAVLIISLGSCKKINVNKNTGGNSNGADGKLNFDFAFNMRYYTATKWADWGNCMCSVPEGTSIDAYALPAIIIKYSDGTTVYTANSKTANIVGLDLKAGDYTINYNIALLPTEGCSVNSDKRRIINGPINTHCIRANMYNYQNINITDSFKIELGKTTFVSKTF
jgi:hypothetical protein